MQRVQSLLGNSVTGFDCFTLMRNSNVFCGNLLKPSGNTQVVNSSVECSIDQLWKHTCRADAADDELCVLMVSNATVRLCQS